jgi:hypothetical protein
VNPLGRFSRTEADTPPPGEIPGLRGAPMRTPVRTTGAATGPGLWPAVIGRMLTRQLWIELYGLPGYSLTLKGPPVEAFAARAGATDEQASIAGSAPPAAIAFSSAAFSSV